MSVHLIANPSAGAGRSAQRLDAIIAGLAEHTPRVETHVPRSAEAAVALMADLATSAPDRVVVAGGDGMVHLAANALAGSDTVLGIVPVGTGNDAARGLGLPKKIDAACAAAMGDSRRIDLIRCGDRWAITVAIIGLAVAINERAETMRFPQGGAKYSVATLAELPRLVTHELTVTVDGAAHDLATNLLAVANLAYFGGGMKVAPDADPTDGQLEVVSIGPASPLTIAALLPTVFPGRHVRNRHVTVLRGADVTIEGVDGSSSLRLRADGEAWGVLPATLSATPGALLVAGC